MSTIPRIDAVQKARKQLEELKPILTQIPSDLQIEEILAKYSDPLCDRCKEPLIGASLDETILHYKQKHNSSGYIKCCEITLKTIDDISNHVLTHLFPKNFVSVNFHIFNLFESFTRFTTFKFDFDQF